MHAALSDLRRTRRTRRLGDTEWFDLAYRVYLAGIFGGSAIVILSDQVGDRALTESQIATVFERGPAVLGTIVAVAWAIGLRSGSEGGPLSIEAADARHLLLAPIGRAMVLRRPLLQRIRAVTLAAALAGGVAGLLAAQRLPGTAPAWTLSGAGFGACVGTLAIATATVAHAVALPRWLAGALGIATIAWQVTAVATVVTGPADTLGSLALWGFRQRAVDTAGIAAVLATAVAAIVLVGRLRIEHLARRGELVSQLRFAVTTQDLRTVVLLRRQLRQEQARRRPWVRVPPAAGSAGGAAVRRAAHGLARTPASRLARMAGLAAVAGGATGFAARGTTPALIVGGVALFVLGLDLIEPLSQEIDHPDRTEGLPVEPGWLHLRLLAAPAALAIPAALLGAAVCSLVTPSSAPAAFVLAVPVAWVGMSGAVVNAVRDDRSLAGRDVSLLPPEMAGFHDLMRLLVPVLVSMSGMIAVLAMRERPEPSTVVRDLVGLALLLALVRWWIVHRLRLARQWRAFVAGATP